MAAKSGDTVRVHYTGTLDDGSQFDSSEGRDPLEFTVGSGQVIPGFESAVEGMDIGESKKVKLAAEEAYGERNDEALQQVPKTMFPEDQAPVCGAVVELQAPDGRRLAAVIEAIGEEEITLDFNHPLAGKDLTFEIELVEVIEA